MNKILIVDNEPFIVEELLEYLSDAGLDCVGCTSSSEAVQIFHADEQIGVVLSDYRMPEMDGIELIQLLSRSKAQGRAFESILFTGNADKDDVVAALRAGVSDYYPKPLDLDALLEGVKRLQQSLNSQNIVLSAQELSAQLEEMTSSLAELQAGVNRWQSGQSSVAEDAPEPVEAVQLPGFSQLTPRQVEVTHLLALGLTNYQISCELGISENTVKLYVSQVLKATNMPSRTMLALALGPTAGVR